MLAIDVLQNKPVNNVNGSNQMDLTVSSIAPAKSVHITYSNLVMCPYELEMRPDLIAKFFMGDENLMGVLLKLNGISNPFSVQMGDVFMIPSNNTAKDLIVNNQKDSTAVDRNNFRKSLTDRISKISPDRQNYLQARTITNANAILPPNVSSATDQQFLVKDGKIIFGSNIGTSRTTLTQNAAKATIKTNLDRKNIFNT